jgi:hypothetical protein
LRVHRHDLIEIIDRLVAEADRFGLLDDDREWLDELYIDAASRDFRPATMVSLGMAAAELRTARSVLALDGVRPYSVHEALRRAEQLRSQFAECGVTSRRAVSDGNRDDQDRPLPQRHSDEFMGDDGVGPQWLT